MIEYKSVSREEYDAFLAAYPRPLERDTVMFFDPPRLQHNDFSLGVWPESVVASCSINDRVSPSVLEAFQILASPLLNPGEGA